MTEPNQPTKMSDLVGPHLPFLRRHARALTGNQTSGDRHAAATLEAILADPGSFDASRGGKAGLFRIFHAIWSSSGAPTPDPDDPLQARAAAHLAATTPNSREALLLHTVEGFAIEDVAFVMEQSRIGERGYGGLLRLTDSEKGDGLQQDTGLLLDRTLEQGSYCRLELFAGFEQRLIFIPHL